MGEGEGNVPSHPLSSKTKQFPYVVKATLLLNHIQIHKCY